ncbi:hypothetical protein Ciccas_011385 [Cichlidogyrus casuarinus]|uniref:HAT C-terminal dimerisation domain-containing protein n=1 Tax=Cichlidogyrus casuarinus TaxID=1844966 RepID=A0ABD2PW65_9PLAT
MLCCRRPKSSLYDIQALSMDCERLFSNFRVYKSPDTVAEFRTHVKWIMRRFMDVKYRIPDDLDDDLGKVLQRCGYLITWRALYLEMEPTVVSQAWARIRLTIDSCANWDTYYVDYVDDLTELEQWLDKYFTTYYERPFLKNDSDDDDDDDDDD